jgi:hypothetical protein
MLPAVAAAVSGGPCCSLVGDAGGVRLPWAAHPHTTQHAGLGASFNGGQFDSEAAVPCGVSNSWGAGARGVYSGADPGGTGSNIQARLALAGCVRMMHAGQGGGWGLK